MKYVEIPSRLPARLHYAALVFSHITIPGDQRSIDHPGHGYPEHTESTVNYIAFDNESDMRLWVAREETSGYEKKNYRIISACPTKLNVKVVVDVS